MGAHVVVIGAGVTGLSAATRLQDAGHRVTIVARDFPAPSETIDARASINYASPWGGAHNRWVVPPPLASSSSSSSSAAAAAAARILARDHSFALETYRHMDALSRDRPEAGITFMPGIEYLEDPDRSEGGGRLTESRATELGIEAFRVLDAAELPAGVRWGCSYRTWCVNPMVYLAFLLRRLARRGAVLVRREVRGPQEAWALLGGGAADAVVVNCSGVGFGDPDVFITRGQTCLVSNPCHATVTRQNADGSWTFCVPRNFDGGTVIGGTKQPDDWDPEPSAAVREQLLARFAATYPPVLAAGSGSGSGSGRLELMADIVGRRPTRRGGMRLELETLPGKGEGDGVRHVVHAYGLGGRGYELSWGVARRVVELVSSTGRVGSQPAKL